MTSLLCWGWMWVMETQTCTLLGECFAVLLSSTTETAVSIYCLCPFAIPLSPALETIALISGRAKSWSAVVLPFITPLFNCSLISSWISLLCVIYLPGCRKWTLWLTKDWRMSFSQTSGARSAWRDSALSVTCWSVMAFYHQYLCVLSRWNAQTYADSSLTISLLPAANLACLAAPSNGESDCF